MPSEKVVRILKSKTDLSDEAIHAMSDSDAWGVIYNIKPKEKECKHEICFSGFHATTREVLENMARKGPYKVVSSVTKNLEFLVAGENAGPQKLGKAKEQNVAILTQEEFYNLFESGEIPS